MKGVQADRSATPTVALALGFGAATVALFAVSFGRWCNAVVDVGSEWVFAETLARGGLLYRDVVYWFGPFTPYFEAAFFRILGSSFATLVVAGVVGSFGVAAALWLALRRMTTRTDAALWIAVAVPALIFMPNSGGSILAMGHRMWHAAAFALLAGTVATRPRFGRRRGDAILAGLLAAFAGLCRTEWGLATLIAIGVGLAVARRPSGRARVSAGVLVVLSAALLWCAAIGFFVALAGWRAVIGDGQLLLTGLTPETREFLWRFSLIPRWPQGLLVLLRSAGLWMGVYLIVDVATVRRSDPGRARRRLTWLLGCLAAILAAGWGGAPEGSELLSVGPLACAVALGGGVLRRGGRRSAALATFGLLGLLLSFRRPFDIRDLGYVAPPLAFAVVCGAALLRRAVLAAGGGRDRRRLQAGLRVATASLAVLLYARRLQFYAADGRVPIPGTGGALHAAPGLALEIEGLVSAIGSRTRPDDGLVVIPEGAVLNFLAARHNPIRHKLLIPGYLSERNEAEIRSALESARPGAIVTWRGPSGEYGREVFGIDYGRALFRWIEENYVEAEFQGREKKILPGPTTLWILRR